MIEAVIFDLDGTLIHVPIDYEALFEEFKQIMHVKEVRPLVDVVSRADDKTRSIVFKAWERAELAIVGKITVNEEGMKTYRKFADERKALVTLQGRRLVEAVMKQFSLGFDLVVSREDTLFRTDQLRKALDQFKSDPEDVLFVGNTDRDAEAAREVGCQFLRIG